MHRSRLPLLAISAAVAACSSRGESGAADSTATTALSRDSATAILASDSALAATLDRPITRRQTLPVACNTISIAARPTAEAKAQAEDLARQAYDAELLGHTQEAHVLLVKASELDGTDRSMAYHLGRTSEALGDRTGALNAYCHYLELRPTSAASVEARQRVDMLAKMELQTTASSVTSNVSASRPQPTSARRGAMPTRRGTRSRQTATPGPVKTRVEQSGHAAMHSHVTRSAGTVAAAPEGSSTSTNAPPAAPRGDGQTDGSANADVVATQSPSVEQPSAPRRTESRSDNRAKTAGIGAVAGAIIGAVTGHSVKDAVIGAAAGGAVGTAAGTVMRPLAAGPRQWTSASQRATNTRSARLLRRSAPAA